MPGRCWIPLLRSPRVRGDRIKILFPTLCLAIFLGTDAASPVRIGDAAPQINLRTLAGETISNGAFLGQITAVEFFATWCVPCRSSLSDLERIRSTLGPRVKLLLINFREDPEVIRKHLAAHPLPHDTTLVLDQGGAVARLWGEDRLPTTFLIDEKGIIRHINRGHGSGYANRISSWLKAMMNLHGQK